MTKGNYNVWLPLLKLLDYVLKLLSMDALIEVGNYLLT